MTRKTLAALILVAASLPASAATDVTVPRFQALSLNGGGTVTIRHGAVQKVSIVRGSAAVSGFEVSDKSLRISACEKDCPANYKLEVEVVAPDLSALAVRGGGKIVMSGFPPKKSLALSVQGGGSVDTRAVQTENVAASVQGGGAIRTWATGTLAGSVRGGGGGGVVYRGTPTVATSVRGGGSVKAE